MHAAQAGASGVQDSNSNEGDNGAVVNRRILLAGLIATTAIGKAEKAQDLNQRIDEAAAHLAALMQARHGGSWYAEVNHGAPAALIARD